MKRLPRGGAKVNYTLYLTKEERDMIKNRATELEMSDSYYIMKLYEMDSQIGLLEHLEGGGTIALQVLPTRIVEEVSEENEEVPPKRPLEPGQMPVPDDVQNVQKEFQKKMEMSQQAGQQTESPKTAEAPGIPTRFQRPRMRSLAETVAAQSGVNIHTGAAGNVRNPGASKAEMIAGQQLGQNWQEKMHQELRKGEGSDAKLRKEILDNLPPEEEELVDGDDQ
jgi:hypothetical protein